MYNRTCPDCTAFSADQGMYAHPVFQTEYAWLMHLHQAHAQAKPTAPTSGAPVAADTFERTNEGFGPEWKIPEHDAALSLEIEALRGLEIEALRKELEELRIRVLALETQDTGFLERLAILEKPPVPTGTE